MIPKKTAAISLTAAMLCGLCSCMDVEISSSQSGNTNSGIGSGITDGGTNDFNYTVNTTVENFEQIVETDTAINETAENEPTSENSQNSNKTPNEMSKGELLDFFNTNLNNIKSEFPAFKRAKQTKVSDIVLSNRAANTLVSFVKDALLSEDVEEKTATKGQSNMEIMSPDGERYVSQLTLSDIENISVENQGGNYLVTVTLPKAENPDKDSGAYAKIFNFVTVDDVVNTYAPKVGATVERKNIKVNYSGCYAKALFSPDGKVISYETYVTCVMSLIDASVKKGITINTDVDITLASTTKFTDFSY